MKRLMGLILAGLCLSFCLTGCSLGAKEVDPSLLDPEDHLEEEAAFGSTEPEKRPVLDKKQPEKQPEHDFLAQGDCGENTHWGVTPDRVLVLYGQGDLGGWVAQDFLRTPDVESLEEKFWKFPCTKVLVEEGVTAISDRCFVNMDLMEEISLPSTLTSVGTGAFKQCKRLKRLELPEGVTQIGRYPFAFSGLEEIVLPESLTQLPDIVFSACEHLRQVHLPQRLTTIGKMAFNGCTALEQITIPERVSEIGQDAFIDCTALKNIQVAPQNVTYSSRDGALYTGSGCILVQYPPAKPGNSVRLEGVTHVNAGAFRGCSQLKSIDLGTDLEFIGDEAFKGCTSLETMTVPEGPTYLGSCAWQDCSALRQLALPQSVYFLGENMLLGCTGLEVLTMAEANDRLMVQENVIYDLYDSAAIYAAPKRQEKTCEIPEGIRLIGERAFRNCENLQKITLPSSLEEIGFCAFGGCENLKTIYYPTTYEDWKRVIVGNSNENLMACTLVTPDEPTLSWSNLCGVWANEARNVWMELEERDGIHAVICVYYAETLWDAWNVTVYPEGRAAPYEGLRVEVLQQADGTTVENSQRIEARGTLEVDDLGRIHWFPEDGHPEMELVFLREE